MLIKGEKLYHSLISHLLSNQKFITLLDIKKILKKPNDIFQVIDGFIIRAENRNQTLV